MKKMIFRRGFTLVELVIVVAIFGVIFTVISSTFLNSIRAALKAEAIKEVRQNGDVAMARIVNDIKSARAGSFLCLSEISGVEPSPAPSETTNKRLIFTDSAGVSRAYWRDGNGALIRWSSTGDQFLLDRQSVWIPPDTATVNSLNFDCTGLANGAIRVQLNVQYVPFGDPTLINASRSEDRVEMRFETTVVNRNT